MNLLTVDEAGRLCCDMCMGFIYWVRPQPFNLHTLTRAVRAHDCLSPVARPEEGPR